LEGADGSNWKRKSNCGCSQWINGASVSQASEINPINCCSSLSNFSSFFPRGDLLFLTNYPEEPVRVGEIVVFKVEGRDIPIVHRVIKLHEK
jgi:hypothetical protein